MTTGQIIGLVGGIAGGIIGVAGGVIGSYFSIKNTGGPRERAFMIKACAVCWIAVLIHLSVLFLTPAPYRHFAWLPYAVLLPLGIMYVNRKQRAIAQGESKKNS